MKIVKLSKFFQNTEAVTQRCSVKKVFLEIWQNSQESACARISFLKTPFLKEHYGGCF